MANIDNTRPAYRILSPNGFFGPDDHLYAENEEIYLEGEPNEEMEPLNELARKNLTNYLERLDALGREAAVKAGKAYAERPRTLDGGLALATSIARADMALMGAKKEVTAIERVNADETPEVGNVRKRGRPSKASLAISAA